MTEDPLVSYVICTFNSENVIKENLDSVKEQNYSNQEIIVVDNCSSDSTREIIEENFPEVKLIVMPNSSYGACETFNIGFESANGDYIAIMDDDVILEEEWTKTLVERIESDEDTALVQPRLIERYDQENSVVRYEEDNKEITGFIGCGVLADRSKIRRAGYYNEEYFIYSNEGELALNLLENGNKIKTCNKVTTKHKGDPNALSSFKFFYETRNNLWTVWRFYDPYNASIFTFYKFVKDTRDGYKNGFTKEVLRAYVSAFRKFPKYFTLSKSDYVEYRPWTVRNILESVKRKLSFI
jgi:GT2 family glycosyltransferase